MTEDTTKIAALIAREYPFHGLTSEEVMKWADKFQLVNLQEQEIFATPATPVLEFLIVYRGKVKVSYQHHRQPAYVDILGPGDYFGEERILSGSSAAVTITAVEDSELLRMSEDNFLELTQSQPEVLSAFEQTMISRRSARRKNFPWIDQDEIVYFLSRKHAVFLIRALIIPVFLFILSFPLLSFGLAEYSNQSGLNFYLISGMTLLVGSGLWATWSSLDWGNDYYIVTNQRVVWIEKVLFMYDSRDEASLYNVQSVNSSSSWFGRFLDYGDVFAKTYTGQIPMKKTAKPYVLEEYIQGMVNRSLQISKELEVEQIQAAIARALQQKRDPIVQDLIRVLPAHRSRVPVKKQQPIKSSWLRTKILTFLKVRYEHDNVITYRKAWPVLIGKIWVQVLLLVIWGITISFLYTSLNTSNLLCFGGFFIGLIGLVLFGWFLYNIQDWRNDIYRLTPTQIFDIEKKPLGTELKKSANLENILTIIHERANIFGIMFNFGNVIITVGETRFLFIGVYNPDRVHQDIAHYQEALRLRKKKVEEAREQERMINWLVAYDSEAEKSEDLDNNSSS